MTALRARFAGTWAALRQFPAAEQQEAAEAYRAELIGDVLPPTLPAKVWVDRITRIVHTHTTGQATACGDIPLAECDDRPGVDGWRATVGWCLRCFPGRRCRRVVTDDLGVLSKPCGQPSGCSDECRWHHDCDITEDERYREAA